MFCSVGYAFILFRDELSVHRLVKTCLSEDGKLYMFVSSVTQTNKKVWSTLSNMKFRDKFCVTVGHPYRATNFFF